MHQTIGYTNSAPLIGTTPTITPIQQATGLQQGVGTTNPTYTLQPTTAGVSPANFSANHLANHNTPTITSVIDQQQLTAASGQTPQLLADLSTALQSTPNIQQLTQNLQTGPTCLGLTSYLGAPGTTSISTAITTGGPTTLTLSILMPT